MNYENMKSILFQATKSQLKSTNVVYILPFKSFNYLKSPSLNFLKLNDFSEDFIDFKICQ